jgi:hypothetical protein
MSTTPITNRVPLRGDVEIIRRCAKSGAILDIWSKKNTITYVAGDVLVALIAPNALGVGGAQVTNQIKSMRFGTSSLAPQRTDVLLAAEHTPARRQLLDANRLIGSQTVEFVASLDSATGNGVTYREAGLFTRGDNDDPALASGSKLFARQVFPDQAKSAAIELEFRWRITFTI